MNLNFETICRICLKNGVLKSLFSTARKIDSLKVECSVMVASCASVTVNKNDGLPEKICSKCISNLKTAFSFKQQCEKSHDILLEAHKSKISESKDDVIKREDGTEDRNIDVLIPDSGLEEIKEELKEETSEDEYQVLSQLGFLENADDFDYVEPIHVKVDVKYSVDAEPVCKRPKRQSRKIVDKVADIPTVKKIKKSQVTEHLLGLDVKSMKTEQGNYQCNQCPKAINSKRSFIRHLERHLGIKSFFCQICQKYYAREWVHMQTHIRPRISKYKCDKCDKTYEYKSSLTLHNMTHTRKKPHVCDDCGKSFQRLDRLTWHKKIHIGLKDYVCQFCSKQFYSQKNLLMHIKYKHTNDRQYQCTRCEKRFVTGECLRIHERRHLGIKKHQCEYCDKCFVTKSARDCHHKMHTKEKPHACRVCGVKFGRTDHRNRHENTAHGLHQNKTLL